MPNITCSTQNILIPQVSTSEGNPVLGRMQAVYAPQGQIASIHWTMKTRQGDPIDLTTCSTYTVKCRIRESVLAAAGMLDEIVCSVITANIGLINIPLAAKDVVSPGIFYAEVGLLDTSNNLVFSNQFYLVVERGQFTLDSQMGISPCQGGPPSLLEIHLALRDSDPADNTLLTIIEFDPAEIAHCIQRPIQYFNEAPPPLNWAWDTSNFPWRYYWLEATISQLLRISAHNLRRNRLQYQAGNIMIDDKFAYEVYENLAKEKWEEYKNWVRHVKVSMNMEAGFLEIGSGYGRMWEGPDWY